MDFANSVQEFPWAKEDEKEEDAEEMEGKTQDADDDVDESPPFIGDDSRRGKKPAFWLFCDSVIRAESQLFF